MERNGDVRPILFTFSTLTGLGAIGSFIYFLAVRGGSPVAGWWGVLSGALTITTAIIVLVTVLRAQSLRQGTGLRTTILVSVPTPLILWGLALIGWGLNSDLIMILGAVGATCIFIVGFGLYIRYLATRKNS